MPFVISDPCIGTKDTACVDVCPVDCIHPRKDEPEFAAAAMLFIHPDECIDCGVCEPECPWEAIFEDERTPDVFTADVKLNAAIIDAKSEFEVPTVAEKPKPTPEQIAANKQKWSYAD
jgi:ferredoxin